MGKTIDSSWELKKLLEEKYGERFEADFLYSLYGGVSGSLDSKRFHITFKPGEYLLISISPNGKEVLDELLPTLNEVMDNKKPICKYDLQCTGMEEKDAEPTIEWDIIAPEDRIREIVNGRAFSDGAKTLNLKLYNGKDISDYVENEQEKEDRIKNAKIYGIYPGSVSTITDKINALNEVDLYLMIDTLGYYIWRCEHDMADGRISKVDLTEDKYAIEYMVYQTKKFGVELPEPEIDKHIAKTPSYIAWYKFYDNHFKNVLTDKEWNEFQKAKSKEEDVSKYMPEGHWTDLLEKPKQKELQ